MNIRVIGNNLTPYLKLLPDICLKELKKTTELSASIQYLPYSSGTSPHWILERQSKSRTFMYSSRCELAQVT